MTKLERAAMQQALEALEQWKLCCDPSEAGNWPDEDEAAITALREALAEQAEQEPVAIGSEWKPCMKLPVVVHVREQREGESHVSTREGITPVRPDDLIMRGVAGEEYPIGRELFNKTYTFDTAAPVRTKDLTDDEIQNAIVKFAETVSDKEIFGSYRAVIAADREKNK